MKIEAFDIHTDRKIAPKQPGQYTVQVRRAAWFEPRAQFDNLPDAFRYAIIAANEAGIRNVRILDRQAKAITMTYPPITLRSELDPAILIPDTDKRFKAALDEYETTLSDWAKYQMAQIINAEAQQSQTWFREGSRRYTLDAGVLKCAFRKLFPKL